MDLPEIRTQGGHGPRQPTWTPATETPQLEHGVIHVWRTSVTGTLSHQADPGRLLSIEELERSQRFVFERDRQRFVVVHSVLRRLLAGYTGHPPESLTFGSNRFGKPYLVGPGDIQSRYRFNLSDAGSLALYAFSCESEIGIDIEQIRPIEHLEIAERFFSPIETAELTGLSPDEQLSAFYTCWTRKEAYIKGHGKGLNMPLGDFSVPLSPGHDVGLVHCAEDNREGADWILYGLEAGDGYAAALAVQGQGHRVVCFDYGV
jgi:4'-phosphopantetheinyl transferase